MQFDYRTEPYRAGLLIAGGLLLMTVFAPLPLLRIVLLALAAGPGTWALLQWRRRGRGVRLDADAVVIQPSLVGRVRRIPYSAIQNFMTTPGGQLVIAYQKPDKAPTVQPAAPKSLTDIHPESYHSGPRYGLTVTPTVSNHDALVSALATRLPQTAEPRFHTDDLKAWMARRRLRNLILIVLAVLATPLYIVLMGRVIASILSIGVYTSGR
jgi:uncharacterized membrane protein YdbT with pleckstrin-like domain